MMAEQLREIGTEGAQIILEPEGRNTAPALTLASLALESDAEEHIMLVMPADHHINDIDEFHSTIRAGVEQAAGDKVVTFGIVPTAPETGYGYIRKSSNSLALSPSISATQPYQIRQFVEKPDLATAQSYLDSGEYLWNSGIFMMKPRVWNEQIRQFCPDIFDACTKALTNVCPEVDFIRPDKSAFLSCPSDSIDYAVMEKLTNENRDGPGAVVIPMQCGWSDVGAWSSLWETKAKDAHGNVIKGDVYSENLNNSLVYGEHRLVAVIGLDDTIVIETADAVLVAHKDSSQEIKNVVQWLKSQSREEHMSHKRVYRPWGSYECIDIGERYKVKRITVEPGASLSLQMHHHRAEHWIVARGTAKVTCGEESYLVSENQSTYVPIGTQHRLENPGAIPLELIEVQSGSYLGEDDIVRLEDVYGR